MFVRELHADDCGAAFAVMRELRPTLGEGTFAAQVATQMEEGYRLVAAFGEEGDRTGGQALSAAGFRFGQNLALGRFCYIDDLSTLPEARGRGAASLLLDWVDEEARQAGITQVHLDSGVQESRQAAHALYFHKGYRIASYHFTKIL